MCIKKANITPTTIVTSTSTLLALSDSQISFLCKKFFLKKTIMVKTEFFFFNDEIKSGVILPLVVMNKSCEGFGIEIES